MTAFALAWLDDVDEVTVGSLFTGYGGLDLALDDVLAGLGVRTRLAWVSDIDPGACRILAHRYPHVVNIGDITKVDPATLEPVDVLVLGFPCQDLSHAGKRLGLRPDTRSGLWSFAAYLIAVLRPRLVVIENVRGLLSAPAHSDVEPCPWCVGDPDAGTPLRALGAVLGDLADLGYDARWTSVRASDVGAPHARFRVFVIAHPADAGLVGHTLPAYDSASGRAVPDADGATGSERRVAAPGQAESGRARPDARGRGRAPLADAGGERYGRGEDPGAVGRVDDPDASEAPQRERARGVPRDRSATAPADTDRDGLGVVGRVDTGRRDPDRRRRPDRPRDETEPPARDEGRPESAGRVGGPAPVVGGAAWGPYGPAVARWEAVLGRPAPTPTVPSPALPRWRAAIDLRRSGQHPMPVGRRGPIPRRPSPVLSPAFVEWMMGLPAGWVTDVPELTRAHMLKALGNGVVPAQAAAALRALLTGRAT